MANKVPDSLYVVTKKLTFTDGDKESVIIHYTTQQEKDAIQHITRLDEVERVLHIKKIEPSGTIKGMKPEFIDGHIKLVVTSETADNVTVPHGINLRLQVAMEEESSSTLDVITDMLTDDRMSKWLREERENPMKVVIAVTTGCWTVKN